MRGGAGHHGDARGERAHAVGDLIGAPVEHADGIERGAQRVGADLGERGLDPLADRGDPGDHLDPPPVSTEIRTPSNGPSPLFSTNMPKPSPTCSPARPPLASVALSSS